MTKDKWQKEIRQRHLKVLILDVTLVVAVLFFTSLIIIRQVIFTDLKTDLETLKSLANQEPVLTAYLYKNTSRFIAIRFHNVYQRTPELNMTERLRRELDKTDSTQGMGLAMINGFPKFFLVYRSDALSILIARRAHQGWFYIFVLVLIGFLFLFFHLQRIIGYKFLFNPALSRVRFIEQLNQAKETFFAGIFHELGTPLTSLMSRLELMMEQTDHPGLQKSLEHAYLEAQRINFLSTEQLHRARLEMGVFQLNPETIHPSDLLDSLAIRLEILLHHHGMNLTVEVDGPDAQIKVDRLKLEQALINLITNSIKYSGQNQLELRAIQNPAETILEVVDQGPGVSQDAWSNLIKPFEMNTKNSIFQYQRTTNSSNRKPRPLQSSGLGLYLVDQIAKIHGGHLSTINNEKGFSVRIHIPNKAMTTS